MSWPVVRFAAVSAVVMGGATAWGTAGAPATADDSPRPSLPDVQRTVQQYFAAMPDYRPGDIITQSQVRPLLARLKQSGWQLSDGKQILERVPTESEFLVRHLRTSKGLQFMRQIGTIPDTYDRLQRMSRLPRGKLTVSQLIQRPGRGSDVIKYLTTHERGIKASRQMSRKPVGKDFHKPTGRIYTEQMLLGQLRESYQSE